MKGEVKIKPHAKQIYCQEMGLIYVAHDRESGRIDVNKIYCQEMGLIYVAHDRETGVSM
jgi:hypothetical protein